MTDLDQLHAYLTLALDEPGAQVLVFTHSTAAARHLWMTLGRELSVRMTSRYNKLENRNAVITIRPLHEHNVLQGWAYTHIILPEAMRDGPAERIFAQVRDKLRGRTWPSGVYWIDKDRREGRGSEGATGWRG